MSIGKPNLHWLQQSQSLDVSSPSVILFKNQITHPPDIIPPLVITGGYRVVFRKARQEETGKEMRGKVDKKCGVT